MSEVQPTCYAAALHDELVAWLRRGLWLPTAGSTGTPKMVRLSPAAIAASAGLTNQHLGGSHWVLALPLTHVAGWLVLARAEAAGGVVVHCAAPFTAENFCDAQNQLPAGEPWSTALVPTQLVRLLADPQGRAVLASAQAVLVGGAACSESALAQAAAAGIRVVRTYGMTETTGGCVYDGVPLPGVQVQIGRSGQVQVAGPVLADGYRSAPDSPAFYLDPSGVRWHVTNDLGVLADGVLQILGRSDDVIVTGGEKVHPLAVERVIADCPGVHAVVVVGVPDRQWGQRLVALVDGSGTSAQIRAACAAALPRHQVPKAVVFAPVPRGGLGKVDRRAAVQLVLGAIS